MLTKAILALILGACSNVEHSHIPSDSDAAYNEMLARMAETLPTAEPPEEQPDEYEPTEPAIKPLNQHFCCQTVQHNTLSGEGCVTIGPNQIDACSEVLYCEGNWTKSKGTVRCE